MPGFIDPNPERSIKEVYSDLSNHLKEVLFPKAELPYSASNQYSMDLNPAEAFDRTVNPEGAIFAEPNVPITESQIRGLPTKLAKIVRKAMQAELKARGPSPFEPSTKTASQRAWKTAAELPKQQDAYGFPVAASKALDESEIASRLLRGTWYRGQSQYPSGHKLEKVLDPSTGKEVEEIITNQFGREYGTSAPTFAGVRTKMSNPGEPHGISLSYDPTVSAGFQAPNTLTKQDLKHIDFKVGLGKLPDELIGRSTQLSNTYKVSRAMPLYGGPPEGKVLLAWKPEHGKEFRDVYVESAREMAEKNPEFYEFIAKLPPGTSGEALKEQIMLASTVPDAAYNYKKYNSAVDELNSLMSKKFMERGWKGMLHSPHRYQEYELRMFDPYEVMHIDKRAIPSSPYEFNTNKMASQSAGRLHEMKSALKEDHVNVTEGKSKTLRDWYQDITREEILGMPKFKRDPRAVELDDVKKAVLKTLPEDAAAFIEAGWASSGPQKYYQSVKDIYGNTLIGKYYETWGQKYFEEMNKKVLAQAKVYGPDQGKFQQLDESAALASFNNAMSVLKKKYDFADDAFIKNAEKSFQKKLSEEGAEKTVDWLHSLVKEYL